MEIKTSFIRDTGAGSRSQQLASEPRGEGKSAATGQPGAGDQLTLTAAAREMLQISRDNSPPVDGGRIAAIREAIDNGSYQVDAPRIAERLFAMERKL